MSKSKVPPNNIVQNKKARHEYFLEEMFEAGVALEGWEVKALREARVNLSEAYVLLKDGEAFLFGASIQPLPTVSTHIKPDPLRTRKLLLHRRELAKINGAVSRENYTCIPVALFWSKKGLVKCQIALAKGKKLHDKRAAEKEREWNLDKRRLVRETNK